MKALSYYEQIVRMKGKADKFDLRLRMVKHALAYGVKEDGELGGRSAEFRRELRALQELLCVYTRMLGDMAGVEEDLTALEE